MYRLILCVAVLLVTASELQAQFTTVQFHTGLPDTMSFAGAGDVNGDGFPDVIVGKKDYPAQYGMPTFGKVKVFSGKDGAVLHSITATDPRRDFGATLGAAGDVNNDGFDDFIVGDPNIFLLPTYGSGDIWVYSGFDGSVLYHLVFPGTFGSAVASLGDVNGDGHDDFAVSATIGNSILGRIRVFSGADGSILWSRLGGFSLRMGTDMANAGDLDGDGVDDLLAHSQSDGQGSGLVEAFSGSTGAVLYSFVTTTSTGPFAPFKGTFVDGLGDLDGDGTDDFIFADHYWVNPASPAAGPVGRVHIVSGSTGTTISTMDGTPAIRIGGQSPSVAGLGDVDGDGVPDYSVATYPPPAPHPNVGPTLVRVFSGSTGQQTGTLPTPRGLTLYRQIVRKAGDLNGDGLSDLIVGSTGDRGTQPPTPSEVRVYLAGMNPVTSYSSSSGNAPGLQLSWQPLSGHINNPRGSMLCTGATPGALGLVLASLAPADIPVAGLDLLVAVDNTNLIISGGVGADFFGRFHAPDLTRRNPAMAGTVVYVQFIETGPALQASNGLAFILIP